MFHGIKHSQVTPQSQSRNLFKIFVNIGEMSP